MSAPKKFLRTIPHPGSLEMCSGQDPLCHANFPLRSHGAAVTRIELGKQGMLAAGIKETGKVPSCSDLSSAGERTERKSSRRGLLSGVDEFQPRLRLEQRVRLEVLKLRLKSENRRAGSGRGADASEEKRSKMPSVMISSALVERVDRR